MTSTHQILDTTTNYFVAEFGREEHFTVGTIEAFAADLNTTPEYRRDMIERAHAKNEINATAWSMKSGACITNSPSIHERFRARCAAAVEIIAGSTVMIEGKLYTVKLTRKNVCDPVHFVPVSTPSAIAA